jgi:hypothetical protein
VLAKQRRTGDKTCWCLTWFQVLLLLVIFSTLPFRVLNKAEEILVKN